MLSMLTLSGQHNCCALSVNACYLLIMDFTVGSTGMSLLHATPTSQCFIARQTKGIYCMDRRYQWCVGMSHNLMKK